MNMSRCPRCQGRLFREYDSHVPADLYLVCLTCGYDRYLGRGQATTLDAETLAELALRRPDMWAGD